MHDNQGTTRLAARLALITARQAVNQKAHLALLLLQRLVGILNALGQFLGTQGQCGARLPAQRCVVALFQLLLQPGLQC